MDNISSKTTTLLIIGAVILLAIISIIYFMVQNRNTPPDENTNTPQNQVIDIPSPTTIPTPKNVYSAFVKNQGVDLSSPIVRYSLAEIKKISSLLPYEKKFKSSTDIPIDIDIVIPNSTLQDYPWVLLVYVNGIDYQVPKDSPQYETMRQSFKQAADEVINWLQAQGVNTNAIIIDWGDKEYIRQRALEWLRS